MPDTTPAQPSSKDALRTKMRRLRRDLPDRAQRSELIWNRVVAMSAVRDARRVLLFATIPGEPETDPLRAWCAARGVATAVPEDGREPDWPDVVIVPGLALTAAGDRLGQGGGWYDRYLPQVRPDCTTIGVGFAVQLVEELPTEPHDVRLHHVVTDSGVAPH